MNIVSLKYRLTREDNARHWRCRAGSGKFRNLLVLAAESREIDHIAKALAFVFHGKKSGLIQDAEVELVDNAGDVWGVSRSLTGSLIRRNQRVLSLEEAQRSILAALLDMDVSLAAGGGIVSSLAEWQIESHCGRFATNPSDANLSASPHGINATSAVTLLMDECVRLMGSESYRQSAVKLSDFAHRLTPLVGRWAEVSTFSQSLPPQVEHTSPIMASLESLQAELDHLQQIDFLLRKLADQTENPAYLRAALEETERQISAYVSQTAEPVLEAISKVGVWEAGLEILVRQRCYGRMTEMLTRIRKMSTEKVRPAADKSIAAWQELTNGTRGVGQEIESCLASILLGMKQISIDLDRVGQSLPDPLMMDQEGLGWFDRLKNKHSSKAPQSSQSKDQSVLVQQRDWIFKAQHDVDGTKASLEYALGSVQRFADEISTIQADSERGFASIDEIQAKASDEWSRLSQAWRSWSDAHGIDFSLGLEGFAQLARSAFEWANLRTVHAGLSQRLAYRLEVQQSLEDRVRSWWVIIGSQKNIDISSSQFLIQEAKAALRYRDGRRQRIQKELTSVAKIARDGMAHQWLQKRRIELQQEWVTVFRDAGLPEVGPSDDRVAVLIKICSAIASITQFGALQEESRFVSDQIWRSSNELAAVNVFTWHNSQVSEEDRLAFLGHLKKYEQSDETITVLLLEDSAVLSTIRPLSMGEGQLVEASQEVVTTVAATLVTGGVHRRNGAVPKSSDRASESSRSQMESLVQEGKVTAPALPERRRTGDLSPRAAAALKLLNPKNKSV